MAYVARFGDLNQGQAFVFTGLFSSPENFVVLSLNLPFYGTGPDEQHS